MTLSSVPVAAAPTPPVPPRPFAHRAVWPVAALVAVVQAVLATFPGYWFDEGLMLALGREHLDWGSVDQPPVAPLLAALADAVAPGSLLVLRLPAIAATAAAVVVAALVARELGGDTRAQALTALAQATGLWTTLTGHWLTPYTLEPLQWLLLVWLLLRWRRVRDDRLLLVLGGVLGVAAQTKFQVLLLAAVLLAAVAVLGPRELLRRPLLWVGAALAGLIALPTLLWQGFNGWPQLRMGPVVAAEAASLYQGRTGVAVGLVISAGLMGTVLALYGLVRLLRAPEHRYLGVTAVVLFVVFVLVPGRPYYLAGLYGVLATAGALGLQRRREAGRTRWRWVAWPATALSAALAVAMLPLSLLLAAPAVGDEVAGATTRAFASLPAADQGRTAVMTESYIYAVFLDLQAPPGALPPAASPNRSYGWLPAPGEERSDVLYLGADPGRLAPFFGAVRPLGPVGSQTSLWLLTDREVPWSTFWPGLRHLDVR